MNARRFDHYLKFQQQLAEFRRSRRLATADRTPRSSLAGVARAKDWLESAVRTR